MEFYQYSIHRYRFSLSSIDDGVVPWRISHPHQVRQNLEIIYENFQFSTRPGPGLRVPESSWDFSFCNIYYVVLIINPMGRILVRWKSFRKNLEILFHPICNRLYVIGLFLKKRQPKKKGEFQFPIHGYRFSESLSSIWKHFWPKNLLEVDLDSTPLCILILTTHIQFVRKTCMFFMFFSLGCERVHAPIDVYAYKVNAHINICLKSVCGSPRAEDCVVLSQGDPACALCASSGEQVPTINV